MTSWDGFTTAGFDAFETPDFDARNTTCFITTQVATERYVWLSTLPSSPEFTLDGDVAFDSQGRVWSASTVGLNPEPKVYDAQGNLLLTAPGQTGSSGLTSDSGQGSAVMAVAAPGLGFNKLVCFNSVDATQKWSHTQSGGRFERLLYANGIVFAGFFDDNDGGASKTLALDASDGSSIGTASGRVRAVAPDGGIITQGTNWTRYQDDLSTVVWTKPTVINGQSIMTADIDRSGTAWLITRGELISIDSQSVETSTAVSSTGIFSWGVNGMAIEDCSQPPLAYIAGGFFFDPNVSPRQWTLQELDLTTPIIVDTKGNFPSTLGGNFIRINGKWSIFT